LTRSEFIRRAVLDAICDDWENIDQQILQQAVVYCAKCGITIERPEIVETLAGLMKDGLAQAYGPPSGDLLDAMPNVDEPEEYFETYFGITDKGMELHMSDDPSDPLDAEGKLRPNWKLDPPP
jgi:hypothetical protein